MDFNWSQIFALDSAVDEVQEMFSPKLIGLLVLEKMIRGFFTIYGRGGHNRQVTRTIRTNFRSPILKVLHLNFEFN